MRGLVTLYFGDLAMVPAIRWVHSFVKWLLHLPPNASVFFCTAAYKNLQSVDLHYTIILPVTLLLVQCNKL